MAASPAMPSLLLLAVLVAAADAGAAVPDPNIYNTDSLCLKTTDVKSCQLLLTNMPPNIAQKSDAKSIAQECIITAAFIASQFTKESIAALDECKKADKCLDSCVQAFTAVNDALEPAGTGGNAVKVPEDERLLAIHASLTQLLRGPGAAADGPARRPPLCKTCCDDGSCTDAKKATVVTQFARMWALLDFTDVVLEELYPLTNTTAAKATMTASTAAKDAYAAIGSTADKKTSPAAGSTADKETSTAAGSTADKNAYPAAGSTTDKDTSAVGGSTVDKETSAATGSTADKNTYPEAGSTADKETTPVAGSTAEKETSPVAESTADKKTYAAAGSAPVIDTAPAPPVTTYD